MKWLVTDLDHTLIYPKRRFTNYYPGELLEVFVRESDATRGAVMPDVLLDLISVVGEKKVAITARNYDDVKKLNFPFQWDYIITSHGADIIKGDQFIHSMIDEETSALIDEAYAILVREESRNDFDLAKSITCVKSGANQEWSSFIEIKLHDASHADVFIDQYELQYLCVEDLVLHENGTTLTILPRNLNKETAFAYLGTEIIKKEDKDAFLIGAGDSDSDLPFMRLCHWCMAPSNSQIIKTRR